MNADHVVKISFNQSDGMLPSRLNLDGNVSLAGGAIYLKVVCVTLGCDHLPYIRKIQRCLSENFYDTLALVSSLLIFPVVLTLVNMRWNLKLMSGGQQPLPIFETY